jgi:branched-chain amino acid transport system permease protein
LTRLWSRHPVAVAVIAGLVMAGLATLVPSYRLFIVGQLAVVIIVTVGLAVLMGGAGLLSLASAAFMAVGGYGTIMLTIQFGVPWFAAVPCIVVLGAVLGGLLGFATLRLSGFYLAIATLGFLQVLMALIKHGGALTGGGYGLVAPPLETPLLAELSTETVSAIAVFCAVLTVAAALTVTQSRIGRAWIALRDNEAAARMQGIDVRRMKVLAFAFTSGLTSLAGALHAYLLNGTNPSTYTMNLSIFHITLVVVGGMSGSIFGAVAAPLVLFFLPEMFTALGEWRDFFYGAVLLLTLILMPSGLSSPLRWVLARWRTVRP